MKKKTRLGGLAVLAMAAGLLAAAPLNVMADELPQGIIIGDMDLGGMQEDEAKSMVKDYVQGLSKQTVTLEIKGNKALATAEELGFFWSNVEEVDAAASITATGNMIARYMLHKDLEVYPVNIPLQISVDAAKVAAFVEEQCKDLDDEPQNATIVREEGEFIITPGVSGTTVDVAATVQILDESFAAGLKNPIQVSAAIVEKEPDIKESDLVSIQDVLGTYSTDFSSSGASRVKNLQVGSAKINGSVLMPGETLSGYESMAPFSTANGYFTAGAYENGQVVDSIGGGVCQIATTLYNASLYAELEIAQRQNHSMTVAYVKHSRDAAIAGTYKDIKVTNNYSTPIYVEAYTSGRTLTYTIYGKDTRPANRTVDFISETLGYTSPGEPTTRVDASMAPGARKQVQSAHTGVRSRLYKCIYIDDVETERTLLYTDNYVASKAVVLVGPEGAVPEPVETQPVEPTSEPTPETPAPVEGVNGGPGATQPAPTETEAPAPTETEAPAPTETEAPAPAETEAPAPAETEAPASAPEAAPAPEAEE